MGPSGIPSPRPFHGAESCTGSGGVHPSGDWSTPILAPRTRLLTPSLPASTYAREIDFLCDDDYTTPVARRGVLFLGGRGGGGLRHIEGVGVATGGRGVLLAHPRSDAHPTSRLAGIIPTPRARRPSRRRRYYIRATAAGRKLIAKILRI